MAESKSNPSPSSLSPEMLQIDGSPRDTKETHGRRNDIDENTPLDEVKAPNVFERMKEEIEALVQTIQAKDDSVAAESKEDKTDSQSDGSVIAAKVFGRAKDEIEKMLHINKTKETHGQRDDIGEDTPLNEVKAPNLLERAVEEYEAFMQTINSKKESQTSDKRDENVASMQKEAMPLSEISSNLIIPINEVMGPNIFERAKDEMEALVHTIHPKKETDSLAKEGFLTKLGKCLEIICSPSKEKDN
ncbi:hypothetical protein IC582_012177 [Cucumis melo]